MHASASSVHQFLTRHFCRMRGTSSYDSADLKGALLEVYVSDVSHEHLRLNLSHAIYGMRQL